MQFNLLPHPSKQPDYKVWVTVDYVGSLGAVATANIWFGVGAPAERFVLPEVEPGRAADLWQTTCFEAFLRAADADVYREWNFASSGQWAAYDFSGYREGRTDSKIAQPPYIRMEDNFTWWALGATIGIDAETKWQLGLSAVLEENDGTKSYWALAHPAGDKPDFHDPVCFAAHLP